MILSVDDVVSKCELLRGIHLRGKPSEFIDTHVAELLEKKITICTPFTPRRHHRHSRVARGLRLGCAVASQGMQTSSRIYMNACTRPSNGSMSGEELTVLNVPSSMPQGTR